MSTRYLIRRIGQAIVTIVLIMVVNFFLFRLMPGSPERALPRNPHLSQEVLAATRERWGLDQPLPNQFVRYMLATARGDLGYSTKFEGQSVVDVISSHFWPTIILFGVGEVIAVVAGFALGAYSGWRRGGPVDLVGNGLSLILYSMPYFIIGMALLLIFATELGWFPTSGMLSLGAIIPESDRSIP